MLKIGDVLELNQSVSLFITNIYSSKFMGEWVTVEASDGYTHTWKYSELIDLIAQGKVKFKSFSGDLKPVKWLNNKIKF